MNAMEAQLDIQPAIRISLFERGEWRNLKSAALDPSAVNERIGDDALCAGINRHVGGDTRAYRKGASDSILTSSLAWNIARCSVKRRPEASVGGVIELRKIADQDADSLVSRRKATRQSRYRERLSGPA